jgi:hypothetical protein
MMLIGVDYHPSFQTIAFFVEETGECGDQELNHSQRTCSRRFGTRSEFRLRRKLEET